MARNLEIRPEMEEREILTQALAAFEETTATAATMVNTEVRLPQGVADAEVRLAEGKKCLVEVKRNLTPATLGAAIAQLDRFGKPGILVTRFITHPMAERLKVLDVQFLDTAGNAYIHTNKFFIYVTGRKLQAPTPQEKRVRALRPTGLKVVFVLLCRPELISAPYRDIAQTAGVALGTVNWVFDDLRRLGYVRETRAQGRIFEDRAGLLNKWVEAYAHELRPKLKPRRYRVANAELVEARRFPGAGYVFGWGAGGGYFNQAPASRADYGVWGHPICHLGAQDSCGEGRVWQS